MIGPPHIDKDAVQTTLVCSHTARSSYEDVLIVIDTKS
jgi:hypothetical protein